MDNENEMPEDILGIDDGTSWQDIIEVTVWFFGRLAIWLACGAWFVYATACLCKWFLIPVLRARGWAV